MGGGGGGRGAGGGGGGGGGGVNQVNFIVNTTKNFQLPKR